MQDDNESLVIATDKPDVLAIRAAFERTADDLQFYSNRCREAYDARRNIWPGKSEDLRKHGPNAFPWDGAADTEAHVINERINKYVALLIAGLNRAAVRAYPVEMGDLGRAKVVSAFLKWMVASYIPQFKRQMEIGANYLLERGIMVSYVGWQREDQTYKQMLDLEQIGQRSPELAAIIVGGENDDEIVKLMMQMFPSATEKKCKKAIKQLRKEGQAELPVVRRSIDCPLVQALSPDGDVMFPNYTTDPQKVPYCFWRVLMTAQQLRNKQATEGWDAEWVEEVIEKCRDSVGMDLNGNNNATLMRLSTTVTDSDLYEVIYAYQRLIDPEDNSQGIYCTVFNRKMGPISGSREDQPGYAKHELLNGYDDYPFVVTKLSEDSKRLYDIQSFANMLRGIQNQIKVERDSRIDRNSLATMPWIEHPVGNPPSDLRPGGFVPYRRQGEIKYGPVPMYNPGSVEMENNQSGQADRLVGLDANNPISTVQQQFYVDKFLTHVRDVLRMTYKCYQRFGPDSVFFRVTGVADPQKFNKGDANENFDIVINFDVLQNDPDNLEKQLNQFVSLLQLDRNGRIDVDALLELAAAALNPLIADAVLRPAGEAQQQVIKGVTDDLSKIYAGIEVGARPNGAQIALQAIQQYASQPDISQRLMQDETFKERLQKYAQQYSFQLQQAQNAQIGKVGTAPAQMGGMETQGMQMNGMPLK